MKTSDPAIVDALIDAVLNECEVLDAHDSGPEVVCDRERARAAVVEIINR